jgi:hypothetical protein
MSQTVTLNADVQYNPRFAPSGAKKAYVARLRGRVSGAQTFEREFLGSGTVLIDEPGLYERQIGCKKGGADQYYHVVVDVDGELRKSTDVGRETAMTIAKRMDGGEAIGEMVRLTGRPSQRDPAVTVYDCELLTKSEAAKAVKGATVDTAIEACWQVLSLLPEKEAKKVLAALKVRVSPPKAKPASEPAQTTEQPAGDGPIEADVNQSEGQPA